MYIGLKVSQRQNYYAGSTTKGFREPYWAHRGWVYVDLDIEDIIDTFRAPQVGSLMPLLRHEKAQEVIDLIEGQGWHVDGDRFWPVIDAEVMRQYMGNRSANKRQRIAIYNEKPGEGNRLVGDNVLSAKWDRHTCVLIMSDEEAKKFPAWMAYAFWRGYEVLVGAAQHDLPKATTAHRSLDGSMAQSPRNNWSEMGRDAGRLAEWFERPLERRHVTLWDMFQRSLEISAFEVGVDAPEDIEKGCRNLTSRPLAREAAKQLALSDEEYERKKAARERVSKRQVRGFDFEELDPLTERENPATLPEGYGMGFPDRVLNSLKTAMYLPVAHDLSRFTDNTRMHEKRYIVGMAGRYSYRNITLPTRRYNSDPGVISLRNVQITVSSKTGAGKSIARVRPFIIIGQGRGTNEPVALIAYAFPMHDRNHIGNPRKHYVYAMKVVELGTLPSTPVTVDVDDRELRRAFTRAPKMGHAANIALNYLRGLAKAVQPLTEPGAKLDNQSWSRRGIQFAAPHVGMFSWSQRRYASRRSNPPMCTQECTKLFLSKICGAGLFRKVEREETIEVNPGANTPARRFDLDND